MKSAAISLLGRWGAVAVVVEKRRIAGRSGRAAVARVVSGVAVGALVCGVQAARKAAIPTAIINRIALGPLVFDKRRQRPDLIIEDTGRGVKILCQPINRRRAIGIGGVIDCLDQRAPNPASADVGQGEQVL